MLRKIFTMWVLAFASFASLAVPAPAYAQGQNTSPIERLPAVGCPDEWRTAWTLKNEDNTKCYPQSSSAPLVYVNKGNQPCAEGYRPQRGYCTTKPAGDGVSAADKLVSYGTITKANKLDRCPLGYFSKSDMTVCTTRLSPAPQSRNKKGACNSNEIDEWGLYCTANASSITREQAVMEADRDFNAIYSANGAQYPNQGNDTDNYPSMVAAYGPKGGKQAQTGASTDSSDNTQAAQCDAGGDGSDTGAAIGGAVAGEGGAVLGSVLGGLGKKKKKKKGC